ncbi:MAG: hypothetical protein Q9191_003691, partial [Dirinaria sp. TL-2023a]
MSTYTPILYLLILLELIFLVTNTLKCYRIGARVEQLHQQFAENIIDGETFQKEFKKEIE